MYVQRNSETYLLINHAGNFELVKNLIKLIKQNEIHFLNCMKHRTA